MSCSQCQGIEEQFDVKVAKNDLKNYRKKGVGKSTRWLLDALSEKGVKDMSLLDIGGGVGMIQHQLFKQGVAHATHVDASEAYLETAKEEAQRRELTDQITFLHGNFVDLADEIEAVDIVTMDKVICCFDDMRALVNASSQKALKYYAVIFPKDSWWLKIVFNIVNFLMQFRSNPFRTFVHSTEEVEIIVLSNGLKKDSHKQGLFWQMMIFAR